MSAADYALARPGPSKAWWGMAMFVASEAALFSEVVEVPHSSAWPPVLALCLGLGFTMLVIGKFGVAAIFAALCLLTLVAWHSREPQEA